MLPSFNDEWINGKCVKPRMLVLEVWHPNLLTKEPVARLLIERRQEYVRSHMDNTIWEAVIEISYMQLSTSSYNHKSFNRGCFIGSYSKYANTVSLTSGNAGSGAVFLDLPELQSHRIGTYLMNEIVTWAQQHWSGAMVHSIKLLSGQAHDDNKERRNQFYEQFGLIFDYADSNRKEGISRPIQVKELTPVYKWQANIREKRVFEYLSDLLCFNEQTTFELQRNATALKGLMKVKEDTYEHPIHQALKIIYTKNGSTLVKLVAAIAFIILLLWLK